MRNIGLQYIDLSNNKLRKDTYEFAIKLGKTITRHSELMHMDLSNCNLSKEEVIFIGMTLPHSPSLLGMHLSGNGLTHSDRIFLRQLMGAAKNLIKRDKRSTSQRNLSEAPMMYENQIGQTNDENIA